MKKRFLLGSLIMLMIPFLSGCDPVDGPSLTTTDPSTSTTDDPSSDDPSTSTDPTTTSEDPTDSPSSDDPTDTSTSDDPSDTSSNPDDEDGSFITINNVFDFDEPKDIYYEIKKDYKLISHLEGHGISDGDFVVNNHFLIILRDFLIHLEPNHYKFEVYFTNHVEEVEVNVLDRHNKNRVINGSFETGNFFGWHGKTVFKGEQNLYAFRDDGITINNKFLNTDITYDGVGDYVYGIPVSSSQDSWKEKMGRLISSDFILGGSGHVSFLMGAAKNRDLAYLSFYENDTNLEIARFGNHLYNYDNPSLDNVKLHLYQANLSAYLGKSLRAELLDLGGRSWDFITFDHLETYLVAPLVNATEAIDIKPQFTEGYTPNQVANGRFEEGLAHWTISDHKGWYRDDGTFTTWHVQSGVLKSNLRSDRDRGLIRSSLFRVDGSGFAALRIGAAQGTRYDKDTFVSVKEKGSNEEILRFANRRSNGNEMVKYFMDLTNYIGKELYFEIVDNGEGSWDTIFIGSITTYYASRPSFSSSELARDLNY